MAVRRFAFVVVVTTGIIAAPQVGAERLRAVCSLRSAAEGACDDAAIARLQDPAPATPAATSPAPARRRDSLKNGAIIGGLIGLAFGVLGSSIADCPGDDPGGSCPGTRVGGVIMSTALWAGIGIGVDAMVTDRTPALASPGKSGPRRRTKTLPPRPSLATTVRW